MSDLTHILEAIKQGITGRTARCNWQYARLWLFREMSEQGRRHDCQEASYVKDEYDDKHRSPSAT